MVMVFGTNFAKISILQNIYIVAVMVSREQIKVYLLSKKFDYERDTEYNRDVFTAYFDNTKLEIFVDRYTLRLAWWYDTNKKVGKSFYLSNLPKFDTNFLKTVIKELFQTYKG